MLPSTILVLTATSRFYILPFNAVNIKIYTELLVSDIHLLPGLALEVRRVYGHLAYEEVLGLEDCVSQGRVCKEMELVH